MQAQPRPSQTPRRQQTYPDPSEPPNAAAGMNPSASTGSTPQPRASSGSGRSSRAANPDKQISQIEKSVTHLLVATKQLLETLTQWSRGQSQEEEVSDVYVRLGYEFNLACRAFNSIGVETADLGNVPDLLRHILEDTLSQPASPQALDNYLPRIRDIIINLLHGLKRKQSKLRGRGSKESMFPGKSAPGRAPSVASTAGSHETGLTQMLEDLPSTTSSRAESRQDGVQLEDEGFTSPPTSAPTTLTRGSLNRRSVMRDGPIIPSESDSSMSSTTMQELPVLPPDDQLTPRPASTAQFPHPPPPPPKQHDALAALQRGGDLERRASRRFSAYQISKHLGASPNGVPVLPPPQHSPIPNRGREVRESMRAVQSRTSSFRAKTTKPVDPSPSRSGTVRAPQRIEEETEDGAPQLDPKNVPQIQPPTDTTQDAYSPVAKTPDEYKVHAPPTQAREKNDMFGATLNGPMSPGPEGLPELLTPSDEKAPEPPEHQQQTIPAIQTPSSPATVERKPTTRTPTQSQIVDVESSPPQGKELTLFLQYKTKIKKFVLADGYEELTLARLQLGFIEKFAWNTGGHGEAGGLELPEIYIQDPVSGVRHELEDLSDVKDRSVLVLNVEALDEVKKHFDDGIGGLQKTLESFKGLLEGQGSLMQRFSDRQMETSKEMARMSALPAARPPRTPVLAQGEKGKIASPTLASTIDVAEVQNLRRDIAVLRQTYSSMAADFTSAMSEIKAKAANVKQVAAEAAVPSYKGDAGRAHINAGKKQLGQDSEALISRVDDLADVVEELRKDVVQRGVRPLPRQLEDVSKELSSTAKGLMQLKEFVKREKPVWTKIWESELQVVMSEREDLTQREEICGDLDGDLEDMRGIFSLVEEAMKQQNLQAAAPGQTIGQGGLRSTSKGLAFDSELDPHEAKTGMLDEVRGLKISHEERVEAIERAERARQKELESRKGGEFQREVESFVGEGKLKKMGGVDEVERRREKADERARRENWETQQRRAREVEERRAERERAKAAAAALQAQNQPEQDPEPAEQALPGSNDTSQEGEAAFQDAPEARMPDPAELPPVPPAKDGELVANHASDGPPQLPRLDVGDHDGNKGGHGPDENKSGKGKDRARDGGGEDVPTSPSSTKSGGNRASRSWWQPAVFG